VAQATANCDDAAGRSPGGTAAFGLSVSMPVHGSGRVVKPVRRFLKTPSFELTAADSSITAKQKGHRGRRVQQLWRLQSWSPNA